MSPKPLKLENVDGLREASDAFASRHKTSPDDMLLGIYALNDALQTQMSHLAHDSTTKDEFWRQLKTTPSARELANQPTTGQINPTSEALTLLPFVMGDSPSQHNILSQTGLQEILDQKSISDFVQSIAPLLLVHVKNEISSQGWNKDNYDQYFEPPTIEDPEIKESTPTPEAPEDTSVLIPEPQDQPTPIDNRKEFFKVLPFLSVFVLASIALIAIRKFDLLPVQKKISSLNAHEDNVITPPHIDLVEPILNPVEDDHPNYSSIVIKDLIFEPDMDSLSLASRALLDSTLYTNLNTNKPKTIILWINTSAYYRDPDSHHTKRGVYIKRYLSSFLGEDSITISQNYSREVPLETIWIEVIKQ